MHVFCEEFNTMYVFCEDGMDLSLISNDMDLSLISNDMDLSSLTSNGMDLSFMSGWAPYGNGCYWRSHISPIFLYRVATYPRYLEIDALEHQQTDFERDGYMIRKSICVRTQMRYVQTTLRLPHGEDNFRSIRNE